ncbi:hypothetical protein [Tersicoccus sp. Bi-70]|uniref:hypothetical protein n=1 Tax=Tersicoccus sp. Bi-70 TaxID=1897634 RepID=UPI0009784EC2|nr:hypothetical protein [Tersicoccus sp. Bi-70]OMH36966.1 hypothetical protein BGP79_14705 [Tersicoccus sp. Bi-70]
MLISQRVRNDPRRTVIVAVAVLVVIGVIGSALVGLAGFLVSPPAAPPVAAAAPTATPTVRSAAWTPTPADDVLTATLSSPPTGWSRSGDVGHGAGAPAPYSCPAEGTSPATSVSAAFTVDNAPVTVTAQAFTAGQGAKVQDTLAAAAGSCAGGADQQELGDEGPGESPRRATATRGGVDSAVVSWRRGDVLIFLSGTPGQDLSRYARDLDGALESRLGAVCAAQDSTAADAVRSPYRSGYLPYTVTSTVRIPAPSTPSPSTGNATLPAPSLIDRVASPAAPRDYPVWPPMPAPVSEPVLPEAPSASPPTAKDVRVPAADETGPGCGWSFTGMKAPATDAASIAAARTRAEDAGRGQLQNDARTWQTEVSRYWKDYGSYEKAVPAYLAYRDKVDAVNAAWSVIDGQWAQYRSDLATYQGAIAARQDFLARQAQAQDDYDAAVQRCEAPEPSPSPSPSSKPSPSPSAKPSEKPSPSPSPSKEAPSPSPSPSPTKKAPPAKKSDTTSGSTKGAVLLGGSRVQVITTVLTAPTAREGCPADRPSILDQDPPSIPAAPTPPADPRPASAR